MSDLKCERWSRRDSNSALHMLQVHRWATELSLKSLEFCSKSTVFTALGPSLLLPLVGDVYECGERRSLQESKKSAGTSKMERLRFSGGMGGVLLTTTAEAAGMVSMALGRFPREIEINS